MTIPVSANLILVLALVPHYGLKGAMWATAASYGLGLIASAVIGRRAIALAIPAFGGIGELMVKSGVGAVVYALAVLALDAGGARGRVVEALQFLRTRALRSGSPA
jgi:O-antigen/teichoic acid export membrane protein